MRRLRDQDTAARTITGPSPAAVVVALLGTLTCAVGTLAPGALAAAPTRGSMPTQQPVPAPVLKVASVSPWVEPDGEFQVRFAPSNTVPPARS